MAVDPLLLERDLDLLVRYSIDSGETVSEAIVCAFAILGVDVFERETRLQDWVDVGALEGFAWESARALYVSTQIWDHQVVVTADDVRIYGDAPRRTTDAPIIE